MLSTSGSIISLANASATGIAILIAPLVARALGPRERGQLAVAQLLVALAPFVLGFGIRDSASWAVAQGAIGHPFCADIIRANRRPLLLLGIVLTTLGTLILAVDRALAGVVALLILIAIGAYHWAIAEAILGQLTALGAARPVAVYYLLPVLAQCGVSLVLFLTGTLTLPTATLSLVLSISIGIVLRLRSPLPENLYVLADVERTVRAGRHWWPGLLGAALASRADILFLAAVAPRSTLGLYAVASTASLITQPLLPGLQRAVLDTSTSATAYRRFHLRVMRFLVPAILALSLIGYVATPLVFGDAYRPAAPILAILVVGSLGNLSANLSTQALGAGGDATYARGANMLSLVTLAILFAGSWALFKGRNLGLAVAIDMSMTSLLLGAIMYSSHTRVFRKRATERNL